MTLARRNPYVATKLTGGAACGHSKKREIARGGALNGARSVRCDILGGGPRGCTRLLRGVSHASTKIVESLNALGGQSRPSTGKSGSTMSRIPKILGGS